MWCPMSRGCSRSGVSMLRRGPVGHDQRWSAHPSPHPPQLRRREGVPGSVEGEPSRASLRTLRDGVDLEDGPTARARVTAVESNLLRITIHEGRNRQVRRMCDAVGTGVRLVRTRIGPITDPRLAPGEWRELTATRSVARGCIGIRETRHRLRASPVTCVVVTDAKQAVIVGVGPSEDPWALRCGPRAGTSSASILTQAASPMRSIAVSSTRSAR